MKHWVSKLLNRLSAKRKAGRSSELLERIGALWHDDSTYAPLQSRMTLDQAHSYHLGYNQALYDAMNEITRTEQTRPAISRSLNRGC